MTARVVALTGSSGVLGTALRTALEARGDRVIPLVRRAPKAGELRWDPEGDTLDLGAASDRIDTVVHLAGENVAGGRWTEARRKEIVASRVGPTRLVARAVAALPAPRTLISASAIGFYGYAHGDAWLDEDSPSGEGFLAEVCRAWEEATAPARDAGVRTPILRTGVVLAKDGGALAKMMPPFKLGVGGRMGSGKQWMSFVSLDDTIRAILFLLDHDTLEGPINLTAPNPVDNATFTRALAHALHRPALLPVPELALKVAFGEMAKETVLASQRVRPKRLLEAGFGFRHPDVDGAIASALEG